MTMAAQPWEAAPIGRAALLWGSAAVVAALAHGGAAWLALNQPPAEAASASPPPAVMIELAPEAVAPPSDMMEMAPDLVDQEEVVAPETLETPDAPAIVEDQPTPPTELTALTPPPELAPPPDLAPPDLAPPPPTVVPEATAPPPARQVRRPPPAEAETRAEPARPPAPQRQQRAARSNAAAPAPTAAARDSGAGTAGAAVEAWQSRLSAHLNRRKRYPRAAQSRRQEGVVQMRFVIDDAGNVLSARMVRSSGFADLDAEAAALMQRASPVPTPPPGTDRTITVPIRFNIR